MIWFLFGQVMVGVLWVILSYMDTHQQNLVQMEHLLYVTVLSETVQGEESDRSLLL